MLGGSLEYTDAPTQPQEVSADKMPCPYCGHLLSKDAQRCDRCDWARSATETAEGKASDAVAVLLSIIPGLGHIYKGHRLAGFLWMGGAMPAGILDRKSTRLNSSHSQISYAVFCLKKKKKNKYILTTNIICSI